ncbi:hypothetical protein ACFLRG_00600 [Bacteroidota bacterium]
MLTFKHIQKVARLMRQLGERKPGFLDLDSSNLEGPEEEYRPRPIDKSKLGHPITYD